LEERVKERMVFLKNEPSYLPENIYPGVFEVTDLMFQLILELQMKER